MTPIDGASAPSPEKSAHPNTRSSTAEAVTAVHYIRIAMIGVALTLPTLSLVALGTFWLWQNGYLLVWSAAATACALIIYGIERWLIGRAVEPQPDAPMAARLSEDAKSSERATVTDEREKAAWSAIDELIERTDYDKSVDRQALLNLGVETIDVVAQAMRPGEKTPLWKFTVPEALVLIERSSRELNEFVSSTLPLSDRLTIRQLIKAYEWRGLIKVAKRAYDIWRIIRLANPAAAISGEARDKMSAQMIEGVRSELLRRMIRQYVRVVGRAAIDLYSGRLRPSSLEDATA